MTAIGTVSPAELRNVFAVFSEVLALPADVDPASLRYAETPGWDSLAHMELVSSLEDRFDVSLPINLIAEIRTVDQLADTILTLCGRA